MTTFPTRKDLIASFAKDTIGVEVGVQAGVFSQEILDCGVKHLHLVDPWEHQTGEYEKDPANIDQGGQDALYRSVVEKFEDEPRVTIHRLTSEDAYRKLFQELFRNLDFFYLDAMHDSYSVWNDLSYWQVLLKGGGRICGHDYIDNEKSRSMGFGVKKAVDDFCKDNGWKMTAITSESWPSYLLERK